MNRGHSHAGSRALSCEAASSAEANSLFYEAITGAIAGASTRRNNVRASSRVSSRYVSILPQTKHLETSMSSRGYDSYTILPPHFLQLGRVKGSLLGRFVTRNLLAPYQGAINGELISH
jgi:hypothetical protein